MNIGNIQNNSCNNSLHFCLRMFYYEIDWNKLGINKLVPIVLRFGLDSGITPNNYQRENILYTAETMRLIKEIENSYKLVRENTMKMLRI